MFINIHILTFEEEQHFAVYLLTLVLTKRAIHTYKKNTTEH